MVIAAAHVNYMLLCVQVMIGQNLTYQAGVLVYATTEVSTVTIAVAVAVPIAALAIIAVLIVIGVVVIMRQTNQKKRYRKSVG